ncbi:MAG: hypothetical protein LAT65_03290 [Saccharospirillum sp.]|nr:hypothetical protein [Saccharospirillum sp.]
MTRHINLMQPGMLPGFGPWQAPTFILVICVGLLISLAYVGYQWSVAQALATSAADWQQQHLNSERQLEQARRSMPQQVSESDLLDLNQRLTQQLNRRQASLTGLDRQLGQAGQGFYAPLQGLIDYDLEGLWLTRIDLIDSHRHLGLRGFARQPGLIPQYLAQLDGSVFSGLNIRNLNIEQSPTNPALWQFSVSDALTQLQSEAR